MPAVPVVAAIAVDFSIADAVTATIGSEILGSTLLANAATGAITGAIGGAAGSLVGGGNVLKGAETGAIGGAVAAPVTQGVTNVLGSSGADLVSNSVARSIGRGVGTTAGALATGAKPSQALTRGLISGGVDAIFGQPSANASSSDKALLSAEKGLASSYLNQQFNSPSQSRSSYQGQYSQQTSPQVSQKDYSVASTGQGQSPGSQALSQALRLGDAGAPIFGSQGEEKKKGVWNKESLRYMGNSGEQNG